MKKIYLALAIIGFTLPNILVAMESIETGNILLYADPISTFEAMFANRISSIFIFDLLIAVVVFFVWTHHESKKHHMNHPWKLWLITMFFGLAGALPLFLFWKESNRLSNQQN